jgi:hypothetical protein
LGVGRSSSADSDDDDDKMPDCLKSETGVVSSSCCELFWTGLDDACSTGRYETLLGANAVSGITFGLYGQIPEDLKPERVLLVSSMLV